MIGEIKKIKIGDKEYELKKQGVNFSLSVQSIFLQLIMKNGLDPDMPDSHIEAALMCGMRGPILKDIEDIIKEAVFIPKIVDYEELPMSHIPSLLFQIYNFQVGDAEKKSETPEESLNNQSTQTTTDAP